MSDSKKSAKKVVKIIIDVLVWLFCIFAVVVTILSIASHGDGVPSIAGKSILNVLTDSMSPTFEPGDIIIGQKLTEEEARGLQVGDIISYVAGDLNGDGIDDINSHRIIEVRDNYYITHGDHNPEGMNETVTFDNVRCKYDGTRLKGIGNVLQFLQTKVGFLVVIVLPLLVFFIYELIVFIKRFLEIKNAGKKQITAADEELIKQRAIEEYLRQQKEKEAAAASSANAEEPEVKPEAEAPAEEPAAEEAPAEEPAAEEAPAETGSDEKTVENE